MDKDYPILTPEDWAAANFYGWKNVSEALQFVVRHPSRKSTENV